MIAVALSGGIDSTMTAHLLGKQGLPIIGIHFATGFEETDVGSAPLTAVQKRASALSRQLDIPVHVMDIQQDFKDTVAHYFCETYRQGKTPNPCMQCNRRIKFGLVLEKCRELGADQLATGHYARIVKGADGRMQLLKGIDPQKDQSYFLGFLNQHQLHSARFPLGEWTKAEVLRMARQAGIQPLVRSESQDVCFIGSEGYGDFLARWGGLPAKPGPIETIDGETVGRHNGLHHFTIGQRRGINCPAAQPWYVLAIEPAANRLVVGTRAQLMANSLVAEQVNWIIPEPAQPIKAQVRVRYRSQPVYATVYPLAHATVRVAFDEPTGAIAPGQGAVFYDGEQVLGAGWIAKAES